jgi:hypothetical protein
LGVQEHPGSWIIWTHITHTKVGEESIRVCANPPLQVDIYISTWSRGGAHEHSCMTAARGDHLELLQWMRAQEPPCPWNEDACIYAANGGHLEVLQWLRAQHPPCPWDIDFCLRVAVGESREEVVQWLRSHPDFGLDVGEDWASDEEQSEEGESDDGD